MLAVRPSCMMRQNIQALLLIESGQKIIPVEFFELKKFGFAVWSDVQAGAAITEATFFGEFRRAGLGFAQ